MSSRFIMVWNGKDEKREVRGYPAGPGVFVCRDLEAGEPGKTWGVIHEPSGYAFVQGFPTRRKALEGARRLLRVGDCTRCARAVVKDPALHKAAIEIRKEMVAFQCKDNR